MPLLFSYGTLQLESVQLSTFGRSVDGWPDALPGYERSEVPIDDPELAVKLGKTHHDDVVPSPRSDRTVRGVALEITDAELASADAYEATFHYTRVAVMLASGKQAWVYVHKPS